jgi:hypothetical protein
VAARDVLAQYGEIIDERTTIVRILNLYHHDRIPREEAIQRLMKGARMSRSTAGSALPHQRVPVGVPGADPDMRMGWLLWETELREFLYFEELMLKPNPLDFRAEWRDSGGGRRRASRNLWVYHIGTGQKRYSITTEAGAKIQPYFTVPMPNDPNLYHFVVQGEEVGDGMIRVWLTPVTVSILQQYIGEELSPESIALAVETCNLAEVKQRQEEQGFIDAAVPVCVRIETYKKLVDTLEAVSDEHTFKLLAEALRSRG